MILVSIVLPFYNNKIWLQEALESVLSQTLTNYEIILVNDGSSEDITDILHRYESNIHYKKIVNSGPAVARNVGIELSQGKYVAFLDSDDIWLENKLLEQVEFMEKTAVTWSHTNYLTFDNENGEILNKRNIMEFRGSVFIKSFVSCPIATPCVMVRNEVLKSDSSLRFSPAMRFGQDTYLWLSLANQYKLGYLDRSLTKVRIRGTNTSSKAKVHMQVKSQLWNSNLMRDSQLPAGIKIPYSLNNTFHKILIKLNEVFHLRERSTEVAAKVLYLLPYVLLKLLNKERAQ